MNKTFKIIISTVLCYLMIFSLMPLSAINAQAAYTGTGTESDPFVVSTGAEFISVLSSYNQEGVYIELDSDITLDSTYSPIDFCANLEGNFHKITTETLLFNSNSGTLKNFYFENTVPRTQITGSSYFALLSISNSGIISGVVVKGDISSKCTHNVRDTQGETYTSRGAMLTNSNSGTIVNCAVFGSVETYCPYGSHAAGIALSSSGTLSNCYVVASISATGSSRYGSSTHKPISGGTYENCYYNSDLYSSSISGGFSTDEMKTQEFIDLLNVNSKSKDTIWTMDTNNQNDGYPVLKRAFNVNIISSKTNSFIDGTETVSLACEDSRATIYYTTDGTAPTLNSTRYTSAISISDDIVIKAIPYYNGLIGVPVAFRYSKVEGIGSKESPYIIRTESDFLSIPFLSEIDENYLSANYKLAADITLNEPMFSLGEFSGDFDGDGHTVSGLHNRTNGRLFNINNGIIRNLHLKIRDNTSFYSYGVLCNNNNGMIYNCSVEGSVLGGSGGNIPVGGLCGTNNGVIDRCYFKGELYVNSCKYCGGLVGINNGSIKNSYFEGGSVEVRDINFSPGSQGYVGGFVGLSSSGSKISNCYSWTEKVYVRSVSYVGSYAAGFACATGATIDNCYSACDKITSYYNYLEWGTSDTADFVYTCSPVSITNCSINNLDYTIYNTGDKPTLKIFSDSHNHDYIKTTIESTCYSKGYDLYTCNLCNDSIVGLTYALEYCDYEVEYTIDIEPTCETAGSKSRHCKVCSKKTSVTAISSLGHSYTQYVSDGNATYYEDGTKTAKCDNCEKTKTITDYGTKLVPEKISIATLPSKTSYLIGENIDKTGLTISAEYSDGGEATFSSGYTVSNVYFTTPGKKLITVTYMNCTTQFEVYVHEGGRVLVDSTLYPESTHDYANNLNETKTFKYEGAKSLSLIFNANTFVENSYDKIYLYDGNGNQIGVYTGSQLAGVSVTIPGDAFKISLTSDSVVTYYGYKIDGIYADTGTGIIHPEVIDEATATCTQSGLSQGSHCEICGLILVEQVKISALGHDEIAHEGKDSTCTEKGWKAYVTCSRCDYTNYEIVEARGHDYKSVITKTATHFADGVRTYTCNACSDSYSETIKMIQHTHIATNVVLPECEKEGYTVYVCECGDSYHGDVKAPTGHSYNGDNCSVCGESKTDNCGCNCHKGGFSGFIWKILRFFYKLFGMNKTCACGRAHY